jgi:hypothetical protein
MCVVSKMGLKRILLTINLVLACGALLLSAGAAPAQASLKQLSIFQDDNQLRANPASTLENLRLLGAQVVRVTVDWDAIAPNRNSKTRPRGFHAVRPGAYPRRAWAIYDKIDTLAHADGLQVYFELGGGAPRWAQGPGAPGHASSHPGWRPSRTEFESFVHAVGRRYNGTYRPAGALTPLPRVSFWSVWNEPNYGYALSPQGVPGNLSVENSGHLYRNLLDAAWTGLRHTGHGRDTILFGDLGPRGGQWREFQAMKPLVFLRALYCLDSRYRQLRHSAAAIRGCPTTAAGSRRFRARHPELFRASGVAEHMWMRWYPPNREAQPDRDDASLAETGQLVHALDRLQRAYGSRTRLPVYDTEFGYITHPPNNTTIRRTGLPLYPSPTTAAYYLNWAEYISWKNPRIKSFDQYLLRDPPPFSSRYVAWSSGLLDWKLAVPKATFAAWRLPLYLPLTSAKSGQHLDVWGCIRPATYGFLDTGVPQVADIQFAPGNSESFTTVQQVSVNSTGNCYFDVPIQFPSSGSVRLTYTYPSVDRLLPAGNTVYSRRVAITLH